MVSTSNAVSSFSVRNLEEARDFYAGVLGVDAELSPMGLLLRFESGTRVFAYYKGDDHVPAAYTALIILVDDVRAAVADLKSKGVAFGQYPGFEQDDDGITPGQDGEPDMAWFTDPSGNIIGIGEEADPAQSIIGGGRGTA